MLFGTYTFAAFLAVVLLILSACPKTPRGWRLRKAILLTASYGFYACWRWPFVFLLAASTLVDFAVALRMAQATGRARRLWLMVSLSVNLGALSLFKYWDFLAESAAEIARWLGADLPVGPLGVILPVGISFYTFQTLSYTIDVYRGRQRPTRDLLDFALFVSFFPQLVAGPIVRAGQLLGQLQRVTPPPVTPAMIGAGAILVTWGLFKKVAIADNLAPVADQLFADPASATALEALAGLLAFSGQIYCDFSGYAHIAIGVALWLGVHLPDNFLHPYAAVGFSDFWRRWHITLSQWLRDYLYIPLGGSRRGRLLTARNLMITMLLGGLWHGAGWHFALWGGLHGLYLWGERAWRRARGRAGGQAEGQAGDQAGGWLGFAKAQGTFALVLITWAFFRADSASDAARVLRAIAGGGGAGLGLGGRQLALVASVSVILAVGSWWGRDRRVEDLAAAIHARAPGWALPALLGGLLIASFLCAGGTRAFIYFQF